MISFISLGGVASSSRLGGGASSRIRISGNFGCGRFPYTRRDTRTCAVQLGVNHESGEQRVRELAMAEGGGAVTQQPRSKKREMEEFVRDLDPVQVQG